MKKLPFPHQLFVGISLLLALLPGLSRAQPLQVLIQIQPDLPPYIAEWEINPQLTNIQILGNMDDGIPLLVQVEVREFSLGVVLQASSIPIETQPGFFQFTFNNAAFLNWESVEYNESLENDMQQSGRLPDGDYEICVYVRRLPDAGSDILGESCAGFSIRTHSPPVLFYPMSGTLVTDPAPFFQWSYGGHGPGALYRLSIVEVLSGQAPEEALATNPTLFVQEAIADLQLLMFQAEAILRPCTEYAVWVEVQNSFDPSAFGSQLRSQAESFYYLQQPDYGIEPTSPGMPCMGETYTETTSDLVTFTWTAAGVFDSYYVITVENPCGKYDPKETVVPPARNMSKITTTGPQHNLTETPALGVTQLPVQVSDAVLSNGQSVDNLYLIGSPVEGLLPPANCQPQTYSQQINLLGVIEPGAAYSWYVVGIRADGVTFVSPTYCDRYAPPTITGDPPPKKPCDPPVPPAEKDPVCQIKIETLVAPALDGGLTEATKAFRKTMLRDDFVPLEAEGADLDQLVITCIPENNCPEQGADKTIMLTGRVKFEWIIKKNSRYNIQLSEFEKLGCLPDLVYKDVGDHVILLPPYIPLPAKPGEVLRDTIKIELKIIDDNKTQPLDSDVTREVLVIFSRRFEAPDHYDVDIQSPAYSLPQAPVITPRSGECHPDQHQWTQSADFKKPQITKPAVEDRDSMVVGQWILLHTDENRDSDKLKNLKCLSGQCKPSVLPERSYEDNVSWDWKIIAPLNKDAGRFILAPKGRYIIYEAPMKLDDDETIREITLEVTVQNTDGVQIADSPQKATVKLMVFQAGVRISFPPADWLPTERNNTELVSRLVYWNGKREDEKKKKAKRWLPALAHMCRIHFMEIDSVSTEPGVCLNAPPAAEAQTCPDYKWKYEAQHEAFNAAPLVGNCRTDSVFQSARSWKALREYKINIHSLDYGGYTDAASYANHLHTRDALPSQRPYYESVPWPFGHTILHSYQTEIVQNGKTKKVEVGTTFTKKIVHWDNRVTVPVDLNENLLPDGGWYAAPADVHCKDADVVTVNGVRVPGRERDDDNYPKGDGFAGDGLNVYEEYRGFKVAGHTRPHRRLDWKTKNLFVHNPDDFSITLFKSKTELDVFEILEDQYTGHDSRFINFNHRTAHGDNQRGIYMHDGPIAGGGLLGIANPDVLINGEALPAPPNYNRDVVIFKTNNQEYARRMDLPGAKEMNNVVAHELTHACNVYHHGDRDDPEDQHGLCSGDVKCYMRYDNFCTIPEGYNSPEPIGTELCTSPKGTGYNKNNQNYGDADVSPNMVDGQPAWTRGNCKGQIRIKAPLPVPAYPVRVD